MGKNRVARVERELGNKLRWLLSVAGGLSFAPLETLGNMAMSLLEALPTTRRACAPAFSAGVRAAAD